MTDRQVFLKQEHDALRRFMEKFVIADYQVAAGTLTYTRSYHCSCGFKCGTPQEIYDHHCPNPPQPTRSM